MTSMGRAVRADLSTYDISGALPDDRLNAVPAGANLLLHGPPMIGKNRLALQIMKRAERPAVLVTSDKSADHLIEQYRSLDDGNGLDEVYIVDCSGASGRGTFEESEKIKYVSSPGDLTGIGMGIAKCTQRLGNAAEAGLGFGVLSLSTLLQYSSANRVFNFTHVMTGRISAAGYLGLWTINAGRHDEKAVSTLRGQFDYVAEIREDESGNRELRILGGNDDWRSWEPLASS